MYIKVLENLIESINECQLINTDEDEIKKFFHGRKLYLTHGFATSDNVSKCIAELIKEINIDVDYFNDEVWINLKGNLGIGRGC